MYSTKYILTIIFDEAKFDTKKGKAYGTRRKIFSLSLKSDAQVPEFIDEIIFDPFETTFSIEGEAFNPIEKCIQVDLGSLDYESEVEEGKDILNKLLKNGWKIDKESYDED